MGISSLMTKTMINSSSSIKMAQIQQSAKQQMKGEAAELESEMKLDKVADPAKIKKVEELSEKVDKVDKWQKEGLNELNENLNKAAKEEIEIQRQEKAEEKKKAEKAAEKKKAEAKEQVARTEKSEQADGANNTENASGIKKIEVDGHTEYLSCDIVSDGVESASGVDNTVGNNIDVVIK